MAHILIAEDEQNIARFIAKGLKQAGHSADIAADGMFALQSALHGDYDLVILDVGLPTIDGFAILAALRESKNSTPVIMCTARDSSEDTVHGLTGGADDYIAKPFQVSELVARVDLRLRGSRSEKEQAPAPSEVLRAGDIALDVRSRTAMVGDKRVDLSAREFTLAELFVSNAGTVLTREQIIDRVWGYDYEGRSNVIEVYVRYLRQKFGHSAIETVRGLGYRMVAEPEAE
ncbi:response regulator transcription factor [Brevibacterium daeguense]|uniref:Response regulator transcription factor n=1 Tax=Brevibacterium daeguense TaxID=909936 RepID=A0ABP8ENM6_9MICO|nr:response regulator transcription factor [Brevibacterium daeguense]